MCGDFQGERKLRISAKMRKNEALFHDQYHGE